MKPQLGCLHDLSTRFVTNSYNRSADNTQEYTGKNAGNLDCFRIYNGSYKLMDPELVLEITHSEGGESSLSWFETNIIIGRENLLGRVHSFIMSFNSDVSSMGPRWIRHGRISERTLGSFSQSKHSTPG